MRVELEGQVELAGRDGQLIVEAQIEMHAGRRAGEIMGVDLPRVA